MKKAFTLLALLAGICLQAQVTDPGTATITEQELRDHIFFLASDSLKGRVATTPEYAVAANYVAGQFAAAGLVPVLPVEDNRTGFFQGLPFFRTVWNKHFAWDLRVKGKTIRMTHLTDFKLRQGRASDIDNLPVVYAGYGIEDPISKWNDFNGLDVKGKVVVCLAGAPSKKDKPLISNTLYKQYEGRGGSGSKISGSSQLKEAAAVILVDLRDTAGADFDRVRSAFTEERTTFQGRSREPSGNAGAQIYLAKASFLDAIMEGNNSNPRLHPGNVMKNYKPQELDGVTLSGKVDILSNDTIISNNVIGMVPGTDPVLRNEFIVVGGHLDHVRGQDGQINNGADDNASGSAGVIEIAEAIAQNPCRRTVIFAAWSAEEMGLLGSKHFIGSGWIPTERIRFNVNLDMIGRTDKKNETTRGHYAVTSSDYLPGITQFISEVNQGVTDFPIIPQDKIPGGSDHMSFLNHNIPAFFFFSGVHPDLHQPGDDADKIDYPKAAALSRLGYLMTRKLGNMDTVPKFRNEE